MPGMFGKDGGFEGRAGGVETVIGSTVHLEGDFVGEQDVLVEGAVTGTLKTKGNLRVGEKAVVEAEVEANSAVIAGTIRGNVTVKDKIDLQASAQVEGDLVAQTISVEPGATIRGRCECGTAAKSESVRDKEELKKKKEIPAMV
ncbi:MAG: polymer-forming cytoskeletal protein [Patescibacteria group bacterium]